MKKKSKYKRKRELNGTASSRKATTHKVKNSAIATGKDFLIGVIGGGIAGAVMGRSALLIGAGVTGYGHYANKPMVTTLGIGMMASSGFSSPGSTQGIDGFSMDEAKARVANFTESIKSRLYLDKLIKKKAPVESSANGIGEVQYLPASNTNRDLDFSALDNLEKQIAKSGADYHKNMQGTTQEEISGSSSGEFDYAAY